MTPLVRAVLRGDVAQVEIFLREGADVDVREGNPLRVASRQGNTDVVRLLLAARADVNARNNASLISAVEQNHVAVARLLLAAGADPRARSDMALETAACKGNVEMVDALLESGANVREAITSVLSAATSHGHVAVTERLLRGWNDVNVDSAIWRALDKGYKSVIPLLLEHGTCRTGTLHAALYRACETGDLDIVVCLVNAGADIHAETSRALRTAAFFGKLCVVDYCLQQGANVHANVDEPLRGACERGHVEVVKRLLAAGANVHCSFGGFAPAAAASSNRHVAVLECLLDAGALPTLICWAALAPSDIRRLVIHIRSKFFIGLPLSYLKELWLRLHLRPQLRLGRCLQRARDRLDRPSSTPLGTSTPTREELIAHLTTAGRRFAREYWIEGIPIFFPDLMMTLGPLPAQFHAVRFE